MSYFPAEPLLSLETIEDVRAILAAPEVPEALWHGLNRYRIKSKWLIDLINEYVATGQYPYNTSIKRLAEQRLGFPPKSEAEYAREGDRLSTLIYNAQCYRHSDIRRAAGFAPFTQEMIEAAYAAKAEIEMEAESLLGGPSIIRLKVREINGKRYAMQPRKRKYAVSAYGQPARIASKRPA